MYAINSCALSLLELVVGPLFLIRAKCLLTEAYILHIPLSTEAVETK